MPTKTGNPQGSIARYKAMIQEQARKSAAFSRLSRAEREASFQAVVTEQHGVRKVRFDDMIVVHERLTGPAL